MNNRIIPDSKKSKIFQKQKTKAITCIKLNLTFKWRDDRTDEKLNKLQD